MKRFVSSKLSSFQSLFCMALLIVVSLVTTNAILLYFHCGLRIQIFEREFTHINDRVVYVRLTFYIALAIPRCNARFIYTRAQCVLSVPNKNLCFKRKNYDFFQTSYTVKNYYKQKWKQNSGNTVHESITNERWNW